MATSTATKSYLLRRALQWNAAFSILSGLLLVVGFSFLGEFIGVHLPALLIGIGVSLILFAVGLVLNARREEISLQEAKITVAMDVLWVVGSIVLLLMPGTSLTVAGKWLIGIVADIVALFALVQYIGIRRIQK